MKNIIPISSLLAAGTAALLFCVPAALSAETVQYWAKGVSETSGWYNTFQSRNGCWAATSVNMIMWWQNRVAEKYQYTGKRWEQEELYRKYDTDRYFGDSGDYVFKAIDWYLTQTHPTLSYPKGTFPYGPYLPAGDYNNSILFTRGYLDTKETLITDALMHWFTSGDYIAQIRSRNHAWTLWGMEVEKTGTENKITKIWVTDSVPNDLNNPKPELHAVNVKHYNDIFYFDRAIYDEYNGSWASSPIYIEEITFFGIEDKFLVDAAGKPIFSPLIPEPSAFGLLAGTLALVLAGTRRRRRRAATSTAAPAPASKPKALGSGIGVPMIS